MHRAVGLEIHNQWSDDQDDGEDHAFHQLARRSSAFQAYREVEDSEASGMRHGYALSLCSNEAHRCVHNCLQVVETPQNRYKAELQKGKSGEYA